MQKELPTTDQTQTPKNRVPKLMILAAQALKKTNPHLFFTLYNNKVMDPEIENKYIKPLVDNLVAKQEKAYLSQVREREENIDECSSSLKKDCCFTKCIGLTTAILGGGVHLGIFYILRESGVSYTTTMTFLATMPATAVVAICFGVCLTSVVAKGLAHCCIPRVPNEAIDLNELVNEIESKKKSSVLNV